MARKSKLKDMLLHITIVISISVGMILFFFFVFLPSTTNHGETVTVPDIQGLSIDQLDEYVIKRGLRFEVGDSSFSNKYPSLAVLKQFPKPGSKVKENRKIIITLNRVNPPTVPVPDLIDRPLKNAQVVLKSNELNLGKTYYVPNIAFNAVIIMKYNGEEIEAGTEIPKGSTIELGLGNGYGNRDLTKSYSKLSGMAFDEARYYLMGIGLVVRNINNLGDSVDAPGFIYKQFPAPNSNIRVGNNVDLWVVPEYDSTKFEMYERQFQIKENLSSEN
ncbi:MAG: PASTA domain-containing protein [Cyclobacteriaceae bacterium]|nr:PASTA domain-containing protein [Cyclobacteriaceae bacterium]